MHLLIARESMISGRLRRIAPSKLGSMSRTSWYGMLLVMAFLGSGGEWVWGATPTSADLAAKRAAYAAKEKQVSALGLSVRRLERGVADMAKRREGLTRDYHAIDDRQQEVRAQMSSDLVRARLQQCLSAYETIDFLTNVQTLNVKGIVEDKAMDLVKDKMGLDVKNLLEAKGVQGPMVALSSESTAQLPEMVRLRGLLAADIDELKSIVSGGMLLTSENTALLVRQGEMVDEQMTRAKTALYRIAMNLDAATLAANQALDQMRPEWWAEHNAKNALSDELNALEQAETPRILELVQQAIDAQIPSPPPPPPLPDQPVPDPEQTDQTLLDLYMEYYNAGMAELEYYMPSLLARFAAKTAEANALAAQAYFILDLNGLVAGSYTVPITLSYVQYVLKPMEPESARMEPVIGEGPDEPASLATLADRHWRFSQAAEFFHLSRVPNALNAVDSLVNQLVKAEVALAGLNGELASLYDYADGIDAYGKTLGLGTITYDSEGNPLPAQTYPRLRDALANWPGGSGSSYAYDATSLRAEMDYLAESAPLLIARLHQSVAVIEDTFADNYTRILKEVSALNAAILVYRDAFARCEQAVAAYDALTAGSIVARDRYSANWLFYTGLDQQYRTTLPRELSLVPFSSQVYSLPDVTIRSTVAAAKIDLAAAETMAANYRRARHDLLAAWETINQLYGDYDVSEGGPSRHEWAQAWASQRDETILRVSAPDFTLIDDFLWIYNSGNNLTLTAFRGLEALPVPDVDGLDAVLDVLDSTEAMVANASAWSSMSAATVSPNLRSWLESRYRWSRSQLPEFIDLFAGWSDSEAAFARDFVLSSHAWAQGDPPAPVITNQPVGTKVARGQAATLTIGLEGTLYSIAWCEYVPYAGSGFLLYACPNNFGTIFRTPLMTEDKLYVCVVKWGAYPDANEQVLYSDVVAVTVDDGVTQEFNPATLEVPAAGGSYQVQFTSTGASGQLAWSSASSATWVAPAASGSGSGSVALVIEPNLQSANRNARVTIGDAVLNVLQTYGGPTGAPEFTLQPAGMIVDPGTSLALTAAASGSPTYQWYRGATPLAGKTSATFSLTNAQAADGGIYTVVATNAVASVTSEPAFVEVRRAQALTFSAMADRSVSAGASVLSASADSGLVPAFEVVTGPAQISGNTLTVTGPGMVTLRVTQAGDESYGAAAPVLRSFVVTDTFDHWQESKFSFDEMLRSELSGATGVYGADGWSNLVKYALGLEPKQNAGAGLPELTCDGSHWILTYDRSVLAADTTCRVQVSTDLVNWTTEGVLHEWVSSEGLKERWRGRYPVNAGANTFMRLVVDLP